MIISKRVLDTYYYEFSELFKLYYSQSQLGNCVDYIDDNRSHYLEILHNSLNDIPKFIVKIPSNASSSELDKAISNYL